MSSPRNAPSTSLLRAIALSICYSLVISLVALPAPRAVMAGPSPADAGGANAPRVARPETQQARWRGGQLLARFRSGLRPADVEALLGAHGMERAGRLRGRSGVERIKLSAGTDPEAASAALRATGKVDFAEPNYTIKADQSGPDDPRFAEQWALRNDGTGGGYFGSDIGAARVWEETVGSEKTVVAVLDSGVDFTHPELVSNAWANSKEKANGVDDDKNGFVDDARGWDFVADTPDSGDVQGHGTGVAGIIAAQGNNADGIAGVMWRAGLMSLRVLDGEGTGDVASAAEAIEYAVANGAQVINCSWGTAGASTALRDAINLAARRGVVVVASAGNSASDIETSPRYPASFSQDNLIAVASTTSSDLLAEWSNWGARHVTVAAPGVAILTTKPGGDYQTMSGSSASAPLVAGVAGLIKTQRPWLNAERTRAMIILGARRVASLSGKVSSGGVLDAPASLGSLGRLPAREGLSADGGEINGGGHVSERQRPGSGRGVPAGQDESEMRVTPPPATSGAPGKNLPNLDALRGKQPTNPKAKPPIPSDRCSHLNPRCLEKGGARAATLPPSRMLALGYDLPDVGALLKKVSGMVSDSSGPLAIFANSPAAFAPYEPPPTVEAVVWKNVVGAAASGNDLTKTAGTAWGNSGASSTRAISYGDGYVEWTASETNLVRRIGLGTGDTNQAPGDITFAIQMYTGGLIYIIENGTSLGSFGNYAAGDKLRVAVEDGVVKYYQNGTLLHTSTVTPAYPLLADTALYTANSTIKDVVIRGVLEGPTEPESVYWTKVVGATASGNDLTKTAGSAWGNAGAVSTRSLVHGDGYAEFTVAETNTNRMVGLGNGTTSNQNYVDIDFAFYITLTGNLIVYESGTSRGTVSTYAAGDKLRVAVSGGVVKYYQNGTLVYTSGVTPLYPLHVDASLYHMGSTITDAVISGTLEGTPPPQGVFWTNVVGADAADNDLTKTGATAAWGDSGAVSLQTIPYGDGFVEFTASETNTSRLIGLGKTDSSQSHTDVTFAFNLQYTGNLAIMESGTSRGIFGTYATGDRLRIEVAGDTVTYSQNGTVLYTRTWAPAYPLQVDTSLYHPGATLTDVTMTWDPASDPSGENYATARLDPLNRTGQPGVDMLSRNINWSIPLVNLPGRAGLDLGLALTYNSLVWTKSGTAIRFDADSGTPAPGFRLGFPTVEPSYLNAQSVNSYLVVTPSGGRVELQQVGTSNVYEAADSSYLQMTANANGTLTLRDTLGKQFSFSLVHGLYRCTQVKDRNGNYITASYLPNGNLNTITDTLARVLTFNYDAYENLISITQPWTVNGAVVQHEWATFGWAAKEINTTYTTLTMVGPQNQDSILVLSQVSLADGRRFAFDYNSYGQVETVKHYAEDDHLLSYTSYALAASATDCPRPTQQKVWAEDWNLDANGAEAEAVTTYLFSIGNYGQATLPDATTIYKETFDTTPGWEKGLTTAVQIKSGTAAVKTTAYVWTQDDITLAHRKNPRVTTTTVTDNAGNTSKTSFSYYPTTSFSLPENVDELDSAGNVLRRTHTDYNLSTTYTNRRIIGLPLRKVVYEGETATASKVEYQYDEAAPFFEDQGAATSHDAAGYPATFRAGRGNLTSVRRFDAKAPTDATKVVETNTGYNNHGSVVLTRDGLGRQTDIEYADSFSDPAKNGFALAYPTKRTPPVAAGETAASFASTAQFNYDFGAVTRAQGPVPALQAAGPVQTMEYDTAGRLKKVNTVATTAYRRWVYSTSGTVTMYWKNDTGAAESQTTTVYDGAGRARARSSTHPGSAGLYKGQYTHYDVMGRVWKRSNPTEIDAGWDEAGDDDPAVNPASGYGWVWTVQTYDWKGRPRVTTNPDGTLVDVTYGGCGCAGGEVITIKDEVSRRRRETSDILGRPWKTEILNANLSVYSTMTRAYNALDLVTQVTEQVGSSGTSQLTTTEYDGYGRVWKTRQPEATGQTVITYLADDSVDTVTDARGAATDFAYNVRGRVTGISYSAPSPIPVPGGVAFGYDPAGNRLWMTDELGRVDYTHDALSRLTSETRDFNDVNNVEVGSGGDFKLTYTYTWTGDLKSVKDPYNETITYAFDQVGRVTGVTGTAYGGVTQYASQIQYRAAGAAKHITYGDGYKADLLYNKRLAVSQYDLKDAANTRMMGADYTYYNDGRLKFVDDLREPRFDRQFKYDHVGRVTEAESGYMARDEAYPGNNSLNGPYNHYYGYDEFSNMTSRSGGYWYGGGSENYTATYVNNRNQNSGWVYDADGRVVQTQTTGYSSSPPYSQTYNKTYTYDAAGRRSDAGKYDGDGKLVKNGGYYSVRSSALGGLPVTEVYSETQHSTLVGTKAKTSVYLGAEAIAEQLSGTYSGDWVKWRRYDPMRTGVHVHDVWTLPGYLNDNVQMALDLQGISTEAPDYTRLQQDPAYYQQTYSSYNYGSYGSAYSAAMGGGGMPGDFGTGCMLMGASAPCDFVMQLANRGVLAIDYVVHDNNGYRTEQIPVVPLSLGLFVVGAPVVRTDEEGPYFDIVESVIDSQRTPLSGDDLKQWEAERDKMLKLLKDKDSACYKFLKKSGLDPDKLASELSSQTPYDGLTSTNDAGLEFGHAGISVSDMFEMLKGNSPDDTYPDAATGQTGNVYYSKTGLVGAVILHEAIHVTYFSTTLKWNAYLPNDPKSDPVTGVKEMGPSRLADSEIKKMMGMPETPGSRDITDRLIQEGCK